MHSDLPITPLTVTGETRDLRFTELPAHILPPLPGIQAVNILPIWLTADISPPQLLYQPTARIVQEAPTWPRAWASNESVHPDERSVLCDVARSLPCFWS